MCQERALKAFGLSPAEWGVNVQRKYKCPLIDLLH